RGHLRDRVPAPGDRADEVRLARKGRDDLPGALRAPRRPRGGRPAARGPGGGVILVIQTPLVVPSFALRDTIIVLVGVVVGGLDRLWTATLGGFSIGVATSIFTDKLPTDATVYVDSFVFGLVILVLLLRPS